MARILVIDDEPLVRQMLEVRLTRAGHEVVTAPDGEEAIAVHNSQAAELVITDIFMPEKDGLETIQELRRETPELKIIAVSGGSRIGNMDFLKMAAKFGASAALYKPLDYDELLQAIETCLQPPPGSKVVRLRR